MKYYTRALWSNDSHIYSRRSRGHHSALLFFDTEQPDGPSFAETRKAVRELLERTVPGEAPIPGQLAFVNMRSRSYDGAPSLRAHVYATTLYLPRPGKFHYGEALFPNVLIFEDLRRDDSRFRELDAPQEYSWCTETEALMGACPCSKNSEHLEGEYYNPTVCQKERLFPLVSDLVPVEHLSRARRYTQNIEEDWEAYRAPVGGFEFVAARYLADSPFFAPGAAPPRAYVWDHIEESKALARQAQNNAAATQRAVYAKCRQCAYADLMGKRTIGVRSWASCHAPSAAKCEGPFNERDVAYSLKALARVNDPRRLVSEGCFTRKQLDSIMLLTGTTWTVRRGIFTFNRRGLGTVAHVHPQKGVVLAAARGNIQRTHILRDWEQLEHEVPELARRIEARPTPLPNRVYEVYACVWTSPQYHSVGMGGYRMRRVIDVSVTYPVGFQISTHYSTMRYMGGPWLTVRTDATDAEVLAACKDRYLLSQVTQKAP